MILAIDTSTSYLSLAIENKESVIFVYHKKQDQRHGEVLVPELGNLMKESGISFSDLDGVVVGLGPGSFTGIRIGVISAISIAQALGIPVAGISSYAVIAAEANHDDVIVIGDARRGRVYAAGYTNSECAPISFLAEQLTDMDTLKKILPKKKFMLSGPESELFYNELRSCFPDMKHAEYDIRVPKAERLIRIGKPIIEKGGMQIREIMPIYLRQTQAEEMLSGEIVG